MTDRQVALVTHGTFGLGAAIATGLSQRGHVVAVTDDHSETMELPEGAASVHRAHLGSHDDCQRVIDEVIEQHGSVDTLVNVSTRLGLATPYPMNGIDQPEWTNVLGLQLTGVFWMVQGVLDQMRARGYGRIVSVIPADGGPSQGHVALAVANAGVIELTRHVAREFAQDGITSNVVWPGLIDEPWLPDDVRQQAQGAVPVGRLATEQELTALVGYLSGPEAGYLTGQVIDLDGGLRA